MKSSKQLLPQIRLLQNLSTCKCIQLLLKRTSIMSQTSFIQTCLYETLIWKWANWGRKLCGGRELIFGLFKRHLNFRSICGSSLGHRRGISEARGASHCSGCLWCSVRCSNHDVSLLGNFVIHHVELGGGSLAS